MLSTFTTNGGRRLIIRSEDVRRLEDQQGGGCLLVWVEGAENASTLITGTADENLVRLRTEELDAVEAAERMRRRLQNGYPATPVPRGKTP